MMTEVCATVHYVCNIISKFMAYQCLMLHSRCAFDNVWE